MKNFLLWVFLSLAFITTGCNQASPQKYFDMAILNSNLMADFAGNGLLRQLEAPSSKLSESGAVVSMSRTELIENRIGFIEENFEKVKNLPVTEETKDMVNASIALYEFVLPVYKNEYRIWQNCMMEMRRKTKFKLMRRRSMINMPRGLESSTPG